MIVVDSSVWVDYFNGRPTLQTEILQRQFRTRLVIGDLVMAEVLQGFAAEDEFRLAQAIFATLEFQPMVGQEIAIAAARNYRNLRTRGVTVRRTLDAIIATFCIERRHVLLHSDHDFDGFEHHLGLVVVRV